MNVYDFDGTIYGGDSTIDFFLYAIKKKPRLLRYVPRQVLGFLRYGLQQISKTELKEYFYCFLSGIDAETLTEDFWEYNRHKVNKWYLEQQQEDDIIISASPEFLLKPICRRLGICHLIASKVDAGSGKYSGENCYGKEKVRRLATEYNITQIEEFYSDSLSDLPLAQISERAYRVKNGEVTEWKDF